MEHRESYDFTIFMEAFILISVSIATILYIFGFIMLFRYKRDKLNQMEEKLEALNNILDSCDNMVNELNNLSNYIITNVEEKSTQLKVLLKKADAKVIETNQITMNINNSKETDLEETPKKKTKKTSNKNQREDEKVVATKPLSSIINTYENNLNLLKEMEKVETTKPRFSVDKVVMDDFTGVDEKGKMYALVLNSKAKDVMELSKQGLDTTEIAKRLGIGKGEIELILGLKK